MIDKRHRCHAKGLVARSVEYGFALTHDVTHRATNRN